jgi:hypothetical protein
MSALPIRKKEIAFSVRDWKGREVLLLKSTLKYHVATFHYDEVLIVDRLKREFPSPRIVIENRPAESENAIYNIPVGGHPCLLVAIKERGWPKRRIITTFHGMKWEDRPKGRVLWVQATP